MFCLFWSTLHPFLPGETFKVARIERQENDRLQERYCMDQDKRFFFFLYKQAWKLDYNGSLDVVNLSWKLKLMRCLSVSVKYKKKESSIQYHYELCSKRNISVVYKCTTVRGTSMWDTISSETQGSYFKRREYPRRTGASLCHSPSLICV